MQHLIIPEHYRGAMSDSRELSVYLDVFSAVALEKEYTAPIVQFDPYRPKDDMKRWGHLYVRGYGRGMQTIWAITVRKWAFGTDRTLDRIKDDTFNPNIDWPEASFMLMIGRLIGELS